ncbi:RHTO0S07e07382g1_1 [Rhodotorula toruloides]|uniref:RHTO0S07e07382g1_1 n=1 Tax=Rhodotorula toruloides TaxID=5286 RepID=A0A061B5Z4_RHOTO|nr:RHTO0S07e07382g1_1 [Rhodotorula toruloides]
MSTSTPLWKRLFPTASRLTFAIQAFSLVAILFEGFDQGVMGGVNAAPDYVRTVGIGEFPSGHVTSTVHQGGIVSIYYLGCIIGCFVGGWVADRFGRINGILGAAIFAMIGGALQAATQNSAFILGARVVTGLGTGALTGIVPVYCSEVSGKEHRGRMLGYVFIANYLGISIAYWLSFGLAFVDHGLSAVRWRFLLAFQCIPAILLVAGIRLLPDSPRYLASVGRHSEAREVLEHIRGGSSAETDAELLAMAEEAQYNKGTSVVEFFKILVGKGSTSLHHNVARRAWLCIWLQIMASWTGITAVTAYSPVLLSQAGYSSIKQNGLAGGLNTIGIVGTITSAYVVDRYGRRSCLMVGALGLAIVNLVAASLYEASLHNPSISARIAPAAVTMLFLFNLVYASTWGTIAFLIPAEIFPSEMRSQGNGFGISGWAIGVGWTVLINPIMFGSIGSRSYFLFAGLNFLWIPIIWLFYPETGFGRNLESLTHLFDGGAFNWQMEAAYRRAIEDPDRPVDVAKYEAAGSQRFVEDASTGTSEKV